MRARYGPGPWPHQPRCSRSRDPIREQIDAKALQEECLPVENDPLGALEGQILAVLARLETTERGDQEFLEQVDWVLREVVHMMICSVKSDGQCEESGDNTFCPRATAL